MTRDRYAVLGFPISHSQSPRIHRLFAEQTQQALDYTAQAVDAENFVDAVTAFFNGGGRGLNCTVPLKELAYGFADHVTERAKAARAVNTLLKQADGTVLGDNTDGIGLINDLIHNHGITLTNQRILILGAGGASRGIVGPLLAQQPRQLFIANRTLNKAESIAVDFISVAPIHCSHYSGLAGHSFDVILNATSASLSADLPPLPDGILAAGGSCYDLAYAQTATPFVRWGMAQHARHCLDGLGMLVEQAAEAFSLWRGVKPDTAPVIAQLLAERSANYSPH